MNSSFQVVIANLNTSLRNPVDRGDGEQPHCYIRADELAASVALWSLVKSITDEHFNECDCCLCDAIDSLEKCDHE